jgi:hypothetical protein
VSSALEQELAAVQAALAQLQAGLEGLRRIAALPGLSGEMARRGLLHLEHPDSWPGRR